MSEFGADSAAEDGTGDEYEGDSDAGVGKSGLCLDGSIFVNSAKKCTYGDNCGAVSDT